MATRSVRQTFDLGVRAQQAGRTGEAETYYRAAIEMEPTHAAAHNNLANLLFNTNRPDEAIGYYRVAVSLRPDFVEAWSNLAGALKRGGKYEEALVAARRALALRPDTAENHLHLADALHGLGRFDEAVGAYRQCLAWRSAFPEANLALGTALFEQRKYDEAIAEYRKALQVKSNFALAHFNLGLALLLKGDLKHGLRECEWRWKAPELKLVRPQFPQPRWDGKPLAGRSILLHSEQGAGDTIQFARFAEVLAKDGARVGLLCAAELQRLLGTMSGVTAITTQTQDLPDFEFHCPLQSVPAILGTKLESIPGTGGYLRADPQMVREWRGRLPLADGRPRIGLVWSGSPQNSKNADRSMTLADYAPLAALSASERALFFSLQKGEGAQQAKHPPQGLKLVDWTAELEDFMDTAALISALDLVITVDTSVAHLAGALGKRVWVMLSSTADWRWHLDRSDSPWYASARLFRQSVAKDWKTPVQEAAALLESMLS